MEYKHPGKFQAKEPNNHKPTRICSRKKYYVNDPTFGKAHLDFKKCIRNILRLIIFYSGEIIVVSGNCRMSFDFFSGEVSHAAGGIGAYMIMWTEMDNMDKDSNGTDRTNSKRSVFLSESQ